MIKPRIRRSYCNPQYWICSTPKCAAAGETIQEAYVNWVYLVKKKAEYLRDRLA